MDDSNKLNHIIPLVDRFVRSDGDGTEQTLHSLKQALSELGEESVEWQLLSVFVALAYHIYKTPVDSIAAKKVAQEATAALEGQDNSHPLYRPTLIALTMVLENIHPVTIDQQDVEAAIAQSQKLRALYSADDPELHDIFLRLAAAERGREEKNIELAEKYEEQAQRFHSGEDEWCWRCCIVGVGEGLCSVVPSKRVPLRNFAFE